MPAQQAPQFPNRVRFNWGFHDGSRDAQDARVRDMAGHYDPEYAAGYVRGVAAFEAEGQRPALSDAAWTAYQAN